MKTNQYVNIFHVSNFPIASYPMFFPNTEIVLMCSLRVMVLLGGIFTHDYVYCSKFCAVCLMYISHSSYILPVFFSYQDAIFLNHKIVSL